MALFFDQDWFGRRLADVGKSHDALAAAAGLTVEELAAVWKDQMEVTHEMVAGFASVLMEDEGEVASRCGVSTPGIGEQGSVGGSLGDDDIRALLADGLGRLARLEGDVAVLRNLVEQLMAKEPVDKA